MNLTFISLLVLKAIAQDGVEISSKTIDARGQIQESFVLGNFYWKGGSPPEARVVLKAVSGMKLTNVKGQGLTVISLDNSTAEVSINQAETSIVVEGEPKGSPGQVKSVLLKITPQGTRIWNSHLCKQAGLGIESRQGRPQQGLHLGIQCLEESPGLFKIECVSSKDIQSDLRSWSQDLRELSEPQSLREFSARIGGDKTPLTVAYSGLPRRFRLSAGLGVPFSSYVETPSIASSTDVGVAGLVQLNYQVLAWLKAEIRGFISYSFVHISSQTNRPAYLDWSVDAIAYKGFRLGRMRLDPILGFFAQSMLGVSSTYGWAFAGGPEVGIRYHGDHLQWPSSLSADFKFGFLALAPLSYSLAIGATYRLNSPYSKWPLRLRAEGRFIRGSSSTASNSATEGLGLLGLETDLLN